MPIKDPAKKRAYDFSYRARPEIKARTSAHNKAKWKLYGDKRNAIHRDARYRRYGITIEQYTAQLIKQGGHCAVCDVTPDKEYHRVLHIDHDHACCPGTGKACGKCFRFLLCSNHNTMLGLAKDDPTVLRKAAELLEDYDKKKEST